MEIRFQHSPKETSEMQTNELRAAFLANGLMVNDSIQLIYSHYDRVIIGGAKPIQQKLFLDHDKELRADYFLERRELGVINIGGTGIIYADDHSYTLNKLDCLYIGKGVKQVFFESTDASQPAIFYILSAPAHQNFPVQFVSREQASATDIGTSETSNERTIYKYIYADGIKSCQLVMGLTILKKGSVWNTMPPHTHTRRMEAYFYFDVPEGQRVFHFMGEPAETRHLLVSDQQAVISPPWSVHAGCGTSNYSFIWGMAGENYSYTDMDKVDIKDLK